MVFFRRFIFIFRATNVIFSQLYCMACIRIFTISMERNRHLYALITFRSLFIYFIFVICCCCCCCCRTHSLCPFIHAFVEFPSSFSDFSTTEPLQAYYLVGIILNSVFFLHSTSLRFAVVRNTKKDNKVIPFILYSNSN